MFIEMILKTFPRSLRAAGALVVMVICLQQAFTALQSLLLPDQASAGAVIRFVVTLIVGVAAAIAFYYFQTIDSQPAKPHEVEILNKHYESQPHNQFKGTATPVFSSHDGEIKSVHSKQEPKT
jgi:hypothetical protein